jgi:VIT1/CCC1 family predicted Fe2+/Mn2+ transporter
MQRACFHQQKPDLITCLRRLMAQSPWRNQPRQCIFSFHEDRSGTMEESMESMQKEHTREAIRARLKDGRPPSVIRDATLGATDGCVTTFAVVAGAVGGSLSETVILILGFANLLADGFSMAAGNYLGAKAENEEMERAIAEEQRHIEAVPEGETEEVRQIFAAKGFEGDLLEKVVAVIVGNRRVWVKTMLTDELGLRPGDSRPLRAAIATFIAFCMAGSIPILAFLAPGLATQDRFSLSCIATALTFYLIGFLKGHVLMRPVWKSGLETLMLGGSAAVVAYAVGYLLRQLLE